ncbi:TolC family protein [Marinilabilia rubra]|uniref:Transporter n=1 Tax=Marinilabilia rubra TaxID=2162893 RepID=A0A2U2B3D1_9BACT|nr:TolC family protein [Marinilabilia rubra]PWD97569.1 transporter [Marinilabilia rubra]
MKNLILISFFLIGGSAGFAQNITLMDCWAMARENYPLIKGKEVLKRTTELNILNINSKWFPQFTVSGQASWQSDVPHVDAGSGMPGFSIPQAPKDQYKMNLDVSQTIYDAGKMRALAEVEEAKGNVEEQGIEIELHEIKRRVADLYFNVLMLSHQEKQVDQKLEALNARRKELSSLYENGVVHKSSLKNINAERLLVQQKLVSIQSGIKVLLNNLSSYIGQNIKNTENLQVPGVESFFNTGDRPEYQLFQYQKEQLQKTGDLDERNRWPVLVAFGQAGYGNPGYNMLNDEFDIYYMVGLKLKWTPWDWKETHRKKLVVEKRTQLINYREKAFRVNQERAVRQIDGDIDQFLKMMEYDDRIVVLRKEVVLESETRLKNGTVTFSDYLMDLNAAVEARINRDLHKLQYLRGMALKFITEGGSQNQ